MKVTCVVPVWNQDVLLIRALESIPKHWDVIIIDDGSTDNTYRTITEFMNRDDGTGTITVIRNKENMGVGYSVNKGYDYATGDYVVLLGSDDYFLPEIELVERYLDTTDMVFFDMVDDTGHVWELNDHTEIDIPGSIKFIHREFLGSVRNDGRRMGEDMNLMEKLNIKSHTRKFTGIVAKHYTYPRKGSLTDIMFGMSDE